MEIPLVLTSPKPSRLVYGFPIWYRVVMGAILAVVVASFAANREWPGTLGWIIVVILLFGAVYEDRWTFDSEINSIRHHGGFLFAARSREIPFSEITRFRITPFVQGTIPGTEDEKTENEAALTGKRGDDGNLKRNRHKKSFLILEIDCADGSSYLIDRVPARRVGDLRALASRLASHCEKSLSET